MFDGEIMNDRGFAVVRGLALHKLLQMLPGIAEEERRDAAERYLARAGAGWPDGERGKALEAVLAILSDGRFGALFSPSSRAEVAIMGSLEVKGRLRSISSARAAASVISSVSTASVRWNHSRASSARPAASSVSA